MSCMKKFKHGALVFVFAALMGGYFLLKRSMINNIEAAVSSSLDYYQVISARESLFGQLMAEYRESYARNMTFPLPLLS